MPGTISTQRLQRSLILIVDDAQLNRKILDHSLQSHGYHNIITAVDGVEALRITHEHRPDLVILDLMMPNMDGFLYCEIVRGDANYNNMPIIVQTALNDMEHKLRA